MNNLYIIPTINRESLSRTINSILKNDKNATITIKQGGKDYINRNFVLEEIVYKNESFTYDWIFHIDDDDYYVDGYMDEVDDNYEMIVLRMTQEGVIIPRLNNETLRYGNVGINFAIKGSFLKKIKQKILFPSTLAEDWGYISQILKHKPKVKITKESFYMAPKRHWHK